MPIWRRSSASESCGEVAGELSGAAPARLADALVLDDAASGVRRLIRSEEHTSELQSLMRISYAVFFLQQTKPCHLIHTFYVRCTLVISNSSYTIIISPLLYII